MKFRVLVLIFCFFGFSLATVFDFGAKLECSYPNIWCYSVTYYDEQKTNITITRNEETCLEGNVNSQTISKYDADQSHSGEYNILAIIRHNCTVDGDRYQYETRVGSYPASFEKLDVKYVEVLRNAGSKV